MAFNGNDAALLLQVFEDRAPAAYFGKREHDVYASDGIHVSRVLAGFLAIELRGGNSGLDPSQECREIAEDNIVDCQRDFWPGITSDWLVILPQWATANRERQGALTESRTTIAGDPFYREWLCGAGQGCRGRILERLYIDNCLPLTVELFHQLAFFILSCKPISYCRFKRIDVYIL